MTWNYITEKEANELSPKEFDLQIAIGLQTCQTKKDVMNLLQDVRQHEHLIVASILDRMLSDEIVEIRKKYQR